MRYEGDLEICSLKLPVGSAAGKLLASDSNGAATWKTAAELGLGTGGVVPATQAALGTVKLSAAPTDPLLPVAVETGDSRMSNARTPTAHTHPIADTTGLQAALDAKAASTHSHVQADVTGLPAALTAKQDTAAKGQANGYPSLDGTGKVPAAQLPASSGFAWTFVGRQAADVTLATASFTNTDLIFNFAASGVYAIDLFLIATATATTTGFRFALDTSVAVTTVALTFDHQLANAGTLTGGTAIADATAAGLSSGVPTAGALVPVMGVGILVAGASAGTARLVFGPEVAASATFKANSVMRVHQVA